MVRTLTAGQETARAGDGHRFHRILRLWWPAGPADYLMRGTSEFNPDPALSFESIIVDWPDHANAASIGIDDEGGPARSARVGLAIDSSATRDIAQRVRDEPPLGMIAETFIVLYTGSTLSRADWVGLGRWRVEQPVRDNQAGSIILPLVDFLQQTLDGTVGRVVTTELLPDAPARSSGLVLPRIVGLVLQGPCVLITGGATAALTNNLTPYEGIIAIGDDVADFAATGLLIIDNEAIQYSTKSDGDGTIGTAATPVVRGWNTLRGRHSAGAKVFRRIPAGDGGYRFVAADQADATVTIPTINGDRTDPDLTTIGEETVAGETAAVIDMDTLPAVLEDTTQERTVRLGSMRFARSITDLTDNGVSPIVATFDDATEGRVGHQFANGDNVFVQGVTTNTNANGWQQVANRTAMTLELVGTTGNADWASGDGGAVYQPLVQWIEASSNSLTTAGHDWDQAAEYGTGTYSYVKNSETLGVEIATDLLDAWQSDPDHPAIGRITGVRVMCIAGGRATATRNWSNTPANQPVLSIWETDTATLVNSLNMKHPDPQGTGARALPHRRYAFDITEQVLLDSTNPGWSWFKAGRTLTVAMPAGATLVQPYVWTIGIEVDIVDQRVTLINEDTVNMTANVGGFGGGASNTAQQTIEALLTEPVFAGLTTSDYDQASLIAALAEIVETPYNMDRYIDELFSLRSLLATAVRDAGIRYALDAGVLGFTPKILAAAGGSVRSFALADLPGAAPVESEVHIGILANEVAINYSKSFLTSEKAEAAGRASVTVRDPFSAVFPWGIRKAAIEAQWLTGVAEAAELADRLLADFRLPIGLIQFTVIAGRNFDLEIGDVVTLTDAYSSLASQVGRIVGTSWPEENTIRLTIALPDTITTLYGSGNDRIDAGTRPSRIEAHIGGTLVAVWSTIGLFLKGVVKETTGATPTHTNGPVTFSASTWHFGVKDDVGATAIHMQVDSSGNLDLMPSVRGFEAPDAYPNDSTNTTAIEIAGDSLQFNPTLIRRIAQLLDPVVVKFLTLSHFFESRL